MPQLSTRISSQLYFHHPPFSMDRNKIQRKQICKCPVCLSVCLSHLIYTLANVAALSLCQARLITNGGHMQSVREVTVPSTVHGWTRSDAWQWAGLY